MWTAGLISSFGVAGPIKTQIGFGSLLNSKVTVQRLRRTREVLPKELAVEVSQDAPIVWNYVPDTTVSVPHLSLVLKDIEPKKSVTVIVERLGKLVPDPNTGKYVIYIPILKKKNETQVSFVTDRGDLEDWRITVEPTMNESVIYVDETCRDYRIRIVETKRPEAPNLLYIGCRPGNTLAQLSVDVYWQDIIKIKFQDRAIRVSNSVVSLPLNDKEKTVHTLVGTSPKTLESQYEITYVPKLDPIFELWAGTGVTWTGVRQSNFPSQYSQLTMSVLGKFLFRPPETKLSLYSTLSTTTFEFAGRFKPALTLEEFIYQFQTSIELRYEVLYRKGFRLNPFVGGWFYFMNVRSKFYGFQRIISPIIGISVEKVFNHRHALDFRTAFVSLQDEFNPLKFRSTKLSWDFDLIYTARVREKHRVFGVLDYQFMRFHPSNSVGTYAHVVTFGGGYAW